MEVTLVLVQLGLESFKVRKSFETKVESYQNKIRKHLGTNKFKPILVWEQQQEGDDHDPPTAITNVKFLGQLCGKKYSPPSLTLSKMEFLQSVSKCFASRPSERNPALLRIYMNGDPLHAQSLQASIPLFIKSTIIQFGMEHGEELSLDFVINNELGLRQIGGVGEFSTLLFPQLLPELCHFVDTFQQHLKLLSQDYHDHPTKELIVERGFRGISMNPQSNLLFQLFDSDQREWLMLTEGEDAWILLLQKEKDPIMSMMMTSPIIKDPLTTLGYTTMEYFPKILSNPENEIIHQLYTIIQMLDLKQQENDQMIPTLQLLLESFVQAANSNDISLFPKIVDNPELRARAIATSVKELQSIPIKFIKLKKLLHGKLSKFDYNRVTSSSSMDQLTIVKRPKLDAKGFEPMVVADAAAHPQFRKLVPHTELSKSIQKDFFPTNVPRDSILSLYWKMRISAIEEPRLKGRKYWE